MHDVIEIKTPEEIELMKQAGKLLHDVLQEVVASIEPGISTLILDKRAFQLIKDAGSRPAFLGYRGFPATLCTSINNEVVHGIPSSERVLKDGDIVSIDVGLIKRGFFADTAVTVGVGSVRPNAQKLMDVTKTALLKAIEQAREGNRLGDISSAVNAHVSENGFSVVREYSGHGIGRQLHEPPQILNYGKPGTGQRLRKGMAIAIEPMVNIGTWKTKVLGDKWTVVTADGSLSAHFEHSLAITDEGPVVLT